MSCNGCRVLRKGCSESCILRPCLQWIESAEAQGHATVFVAKFFGRAGLMSFISNVPENQRPALFQSLLFEAAGRTVNPVNGAVGLLWTGNWHVCQAAVEKVLRGGALRPIPEFVGGGQPAEMDELSGCTDMFKLNNNYNNNNKDYSSSTTPSSRSNKAVQKRRRCGDGPPAKVTQLADLDLSLVPGFQNDDASSRRGSGGKVVISSCPGNERRRLASPSMNSEESGTTTCLESSSFNKQQGRSSSQPKLLNLFG